MAWVRWQFLLVVQDQNPGTTGSAAKAAISLERSMAPVLAMAAKLARLDYRMLRYGMKYAGQGAQLYETQYRKQQVIHPKRKAAQLGLQTIEGAAAA